MSLTPNYVPRQFKTLNVLLKVNDGDRALKFYNSAFDAEILQELRSPDGVLRYAEMKVADTIIMLTEDKTVSGDNDGVVLSLYTGDVEALMEATILGGAVKLSEIKTHFYGDRGGLVKDPFGLTWFLSTHVEDVPANVLKHRFDELYS